jgi:hypothetical protein
LVYMIQRISIICKADFDSVQYLTGRVVAEQRFCARDPAGAHARPFKTINKKKVETLCMALQSTWKWNIKMLKSARILDPRESGFFF